MQSNLFDKADERHISDFQPQDVNRERLGHVVDCPITIHRHCFFVRNDVLRIGKRVLVGAGIAVHHQRIALYGSTVLESQMSIVLFRMWVYHLHKQFTCLVVDVRRYIEQSSLRVLHIEVVDDFAIEVALDMKAFLHNFNVIFTADAHIAFDRCQDRLHAIDVLLNAVSGVAPSADGPPGVVAFILKIERYEESLCTAQFSGLHRINNVLRIESLAQGIGAAGACCRGIFQHSVLHAPLSGLVCPVVGRRRGCIEDDVAIEVGDLDVPKLRRRRPCGHAQRAKRRKVALFLPFHVLASDVAAIHHLGIV